MTHSVQTYLEAPLRRPLSVAIPALVIVAGAVVASFVVPKRYSASAVIGVESDPTSSGIPQGMEVGLSERKLEMLTARILRRSRLERVIQEESPDLTKAERARQIESLRNALSVRAAAADTLLVQCVHAEPATAARLANRVADLFVEEAGSERRTAALGGAEQFEARLAEARKVLEAREAALRRSQDQPPDSQAGRSSAGALRQLQIERQALTGKLLVQQTEADLLRREIEREKGTHAGLQASRTPELEQLRSRLAELRKRYTDRYPDVQAVLRRIQDLEAGAPATVQPGPVASVAQGELEKAEQEIEGLKQRGAEIDAEIARLGELTSRQPDTAEKRAALSRDYSQAQEAYVALLKQWTDAQATQQREQIWPREHYRVREPARVPTSPCFPNRLAFALGGLFGGLALGLAVAVTREFYDRSVKGPEDLEEILQVPLLACIPEVGRRSARAQRQPSETS